MTSSTLRSAAALADAGLLGRDRLPALAEVAARYAVALTPALAALIDPDDPADPIARQFVPDPAELVVSDAERADPIGDHVHSPVRGIVHRYPDRVLLKATHTCAVYCRFCFRREMVGPGKAKALSPAELDAALAYIAGDPAIWEVILTGGDPLMLSPRRLSALMARLARIEHVKVVRFHTRVPVADPAMITTELVAAMKSPTQATTSAANSARAMSSRSAAATARSTFWSTVARIAACRSAPPIAGPRRSSSVRITNGRMTSPAICSASRSAGAIAARVGCPPISARRTTGYSVSLSRAATAWSSPASAPPPDRRSNSPS